MFKNMANISSHSKPDLDEEFSFTTTTVTFQSVVNEEAAVTDAFVTTMSEVDIKSIDTSDVGNLLGKFKRWQIIYFATIVYIYGVTSFSSLGVIFLAPDLNFTCVEQSHVTFTNFTGILNAKTLENNQCEYVANGSVVPCNSWEYDRSFYKQTFTEEYNLVCSRSYMKSLANSLQHVGDVVGALFLGHLADRYGRRRVLLSSMFCGITASLLSQFAPSFEYILVGKVFYGFSGIGLASVGFVLQKAAVLLKICGIEYRGILGIAVEFGWVTYYVALPGLSWLLRDSNYLQWIFTISYFLLCLMYFTVPESPRWLLLKNRPKEAIKVMQKALDMNKMEINNLDEVVAKLSSIIKLSEQNVKSNSAIDLFRTPSLRKRTLILYLYWFVNGFVYYGISQNAGIFGSDYYLNFFLFGVVEFPAYIIFALILRRGGRKWPLGIIMGLAGVFTGLVGLIPTSENIYWLVVTLTVLGKFCIASSFALAYPYTTEAFPTAVRGIGLGTCSTCARISATIAPFVRELEEVIGLAGVMGIFGIMGIVSGVTVYWLPETRGTPLADTLLQGEHIGQESELVPVSRDNGTDL